MYRLLIIFNIVLNFFVLVASGDEEIPFVTGAAFAPDGKSWGAATTEGFQQYALQNKSCIYRYPLVNLKFFRWLPDSNRVLLASWVENEIPTYSLLNTQENRILNSFTEEMRWFYNQYRRYIYDTDSYEIHVTDSVHPSLTEMNHPYSLAFSSDGKEMAYTAKDGNIRIRLVENGEIIKEIPVQEYYVAALGYAGSGSTLWAGTVFTNIQEFGKVVQLLTIDRQSGSIFQMQEFPKSANAYISSHIFDVSSDQKYALVISITIWYGGSDFTRFIQLLDIETGDLISTIIQPFLRNGAYLETRALFGQENRIYGAYTSIAEGFTTWGTSMYDSGNLVVRLSDSSGIWSSHDLKLPVNPISPDGKKFLMIDESNFYLTDRSSLKYEVVPAQQTGVLNYLKYE